MKIEDIGLSEDLNKVSIVRTLGRDTWLGSPAMSGILLTGPGSLKRF